MANNKKLISKGYAILMLLFLVAIAPLAPTKAETNKVFFSENFDNTSNTSNELPLSLQLLGGGALWAAAEKGTSTLYVNWEDNYLAHHLTDGATWGPYPSEQFMKNSRNAISASLTESGFNISFTGDLPNDLSAYSLIVIEAYWAFTPQNAKQIQNYIFNGGGVIFLSGSPCFLVSYSKNWNTYEASNPTAYTGSLSPIDTWFGAGQYINTGGSAKTVVNNPFYTSLQTNEPIFSTSSFGCESVTSLGQNATAIAIWDSRSMFAFTNEYGKGRIYYQAAIDTTSDFSQPNILANHLLPTLTAACASSTSITGFMVSINGKLSFNNTGITQAPIILSYSLTGGETWQDLTFLLTDNNGDFSATWAPLVTGNFFIKAKWNGNSSFAPVTITVSLVVTPLTIQDTQNLISIASNSTISEFMFNSTSKKLSFTVSGPQDTTGYIDFYFPKSLISDISDLQVYIDGSPITYSYDSQGESWLITFMYHHSTHEVVIDLNKTSLASLNISQLLQGIIYGTIISLIIIAVVFVILRKKSLVLKEKN